MRALLFPFGLAPFFLLAQCGMTVTPPFESPGCDGFNGSVWMSATINGGTPPYTLSYNGLPGVPWTSSSASINKVVWSNCPSVMACANPPHNGIIQVTDALGCTASNSGTVGGFAVGPFWPGVRSVSNDCIIGTYTVTFTPTGGEMSLAWWAMSGDTQATYTLGRNGGAYASGQLNTVLLTNPYRLDFSALPSGSYNLSITLPSSTSSTRWCPTTYQTTFFLPNAGDCGSNFRMKAALCGALPSGTIMNDGLRSQNLVPTTEPYSALGYVYAGSTASATIPASLLTVTGNDAVVDWVIVELRATASPHVVLYSRPALIQRDGDLIDLDGDDYLNVPIAPGYYRVALRHRNHLAVMTGTDYSLQFTDLVTVNLRIANALYGTSPISIVGSTRCLWPGDVTFDGTVKYAGGSNDRDPILTLIGGTTPTNTVANVYNGADLNLDGTVKYAGSANDRDIILQTVGGSVPTATRAQQLP